MKKSLIGWIIKIGFGIMMTVAGASALIENTAKGIVNFLFPYAPGWETVIRLPQTNFAVWLWQTAPSKWGITTVFLAETLVVATVVVCLMILLEMTSEAIESVTILEPS